MIPGILAGLGFLYGNDRYQQSRMEQSRGRLRELIGQPATATPYQAGPEQMFPGEAPIQGLHNIQQGAGVLGGEITPAQFYGGLLEVPGYEQIGAQGLLSMQQQATQRPDSPFSKINPADYTPESVARFQQSGNYADLQTRASDAEALQQQFKNAGALRGEFTKITNNFADINDAYGRIYASAESPSPAGDMALIFNYMKMLDPASVVRESEFQTAAMAGDYGDRIKNLVSRALSGQMLTDSQRNDFVGRASRLYREAEQIHGKREAEYRRLAERQGVDPASVIFERRQYSGQSPGVPQGSNRVRRYNPQTGRIE